MSELAKRSKKIKKKEVNGVAAKAQIDEIFSSKKKKEPVEATGKSTGETKEKKKPKSAIKLTKRMMDKERAGEEVRRYTDDGLPIYSLKEFQQKYDVGKGGDTDKCPFDCDCCF
mmetsp:Transcript_64311/g.74761  ORF Transcript_64311/g.74761 Transcript_64311/m.74761 type:complete len:114 (-) Transcript_64311:199-540(-)